MSFWKRDDIRPQTPQPPEPEPAVEKKSVELLAESVRLLKASLKLEAQEKLAPVLKARKADEELPAHT